MTKINNNTVVEYIAVKDGVVVDTVKTTGGAVGALEVLKRTNPQAIVYVRVTGQ